ncbi:unnamed protein product [Tilletia controversa]|nr:unnamed protein product [Tilletia controversa]
MDGNPTLHRAVGGEHNKYIVTYRTQNGEVLPPDEALRPQPKACREDENLRPSQHCRVCTEHARREQAGEEPDPDQVCSFQGVRIVRLGGTKDAKKKDERYVPGAWLNEKDNSGPEQSLTEIVDGMGTLPSENIHGDLGAIMMGKFATDVAPLIDEEYIHAVQMETYVFQRRWDGQDPPQCTHCACYMGGSWFCTQCGAEVCLTCFRKITTSPRDEDELVEGNSVCACDPGAASDSNWNTHQSTFFFPIARRTIDQLSLERMVVWATAARFEGRNGEHGSTVEALGKIAAAIQCEMEHKEGEPNDLAHLRDDSTRAVTENVSTLPTPVIRIDGTMTEEKRNIRVLKMSIAFKDPFIVQQSMVKPLDQDGLRGLMKDPDERDVHVRVIRSSSAPGTVQSETWSWNQIVDELDGVTCKTRFLDMRDFPTDGTLTEKSPSATEMFHKASGFPSLGECLGLQREDFDENDVRVWGDVAPWCCVRKRDAKEKCYVALASEEKGGDTTSLHVDEAGAMNVLLWVGTRRAPPDIVYGERIPMDTDDSTITGEPTVEQLDDRLVGAEWLWWKPEARQWFNEAARACSTDSDWDGDVLYSHTFTATARFIDKVVELGGGELCRARVILQRVGESVYIPPGVPHQVARDIMPPTGVHQMIAVQAARAEASALGGFKALDACMIRHVLLLAWRVCIASIKTYSWAGEVGLGDDALALRHETARLRSEHREASWIERQRLERAEKKIATLERQLEELKTISASRVTPEGNVITVEVVQRFLEYLNHGELGV